MFPVLVLVVVLVMAGDTAALQCLHCGTDTTVRTCS